jgi:hypothetical protein
LKGGTILVVEAWLPDFGGLEVPNGNLSSQLPWQVASTVIASNERLIYAQRA